jgi:hypothetical protein
MPEGKQFCRGEHAYVPSNEVHRCGSRLVHKVADGDCHQVTTGSPCNCETGERTTNHGLSGLRTITVFRAVK